MNLFRSMAEIPSDFGPSALTIGNFDGVHRGHRAILKRVVALARERGWKPSALTFHPHPMSVVAPDRAPRLLTSPERRVQLMREEGIQQVLILPFTEEVAHWPPEDFVRVLLAGRLGVRAVLVGDNFRFGHRHAGNVHLLADLGRQFGFETETIPAVSWRGRIVSSSAIREALLAGQVARANRMLQHPYSVEGEVVHGRGVGARQTVPTLNLSTAADVVPARGVYLTRTFALDSPRQWNSITNIGYRPTFGASDALSIETFLLDPFDGEAPGRIRVEFLCRVREERRFENPEALKAQILRDVRVAQNYFRRTRTSWNCPVTRP